MASIPQHSIKRALISVYDKTGIVDFARALVTEFGIEIISTGGTAALLKQEGIPVTLVEEVTGFPEMLDGRVKTLHPKIHAAILADRDNPEHMRQLAEQGIKPIDMVVVNLYPFEKTVADPNCTLEQAIEMIDIGGPCMLRAAAKNHRHVLSVPLAGCYGEVLDSLRGIGSERPADHRVSLATTTFWHTAEYDEAITSWIIRDPDEQLPYVQFLQLHRWIHLRYGENPHQSGELRSISGHIRVGPGIKPPLWHVVRDGLSFNNLVDSDSSIKLCAEISRSSFHDRRSCSVFIKHNNPCGVGLEFDSTKSYRQAYLGDPNAAMGGILACSFAITPTFAEVVMDTFNTWGKAAGSGGFFIEVWVAPTFEEAAVEIIRSRKTWGKNCQLLGVGDMNEPQDDREFEYRSIGGHMLVQAPDRVGLNEDQWKVVTKRHPSESEISDLRLAWLIAKHTKSNAISICKDGMLIGNGAGQMSRVMSCRIATWLANENGHSEKLRGSVAASDAFFPFADGPNILIDAGVTAIIQPGGSKRDEEVIAACDARGVAMIFTGTRHFRH